MSLRNLLSVVSPPMVRAESNFDQTKWQAVQLKLNVVWPDDYRELISAYGSGSFFDAGRLRLFVYNPLSVNFEDQFQSQHENLIGMKLGEGDDFVPYSVYPDTPGLLPCGSDDRGNEMYWLTSGKPNKWKIVLRSDDSQFQEFDGPLTSFLARIFKRKIVADIWPAPFFSVLENIRFEPDSATIEQTVTLKNLYTLYLENNWSAGFWARKWSSQAGICFFIKSINGNSSGMLPGIPVEFGRPRVVMDLYLNDTLLQRDVELPDAYQVAFIRVEHDPPDLR